MNNMRLLKVSRDQGETWTEEMVDVKVIDPEVSPLKEGDLVEYQDTRYIVVANEAENKMTSPFLGGFPDGGLYLKKMR